MRRTLGLLMVVCLAASFALGQSPTATVTGRVLDPTNAVIQGARVEVINLDTNVRYSSATNSEGLYTVPNLPPGTYRIEVSRSSFKTAIKPDIVLHVQDVVALNFTLAVGSTAESVTVEGRAPLVDTQPSSVSTVVDRQFVENMPLNGRSFQSLIAQTPGAVVVPGDFEEPGQFSFNGQRATSNYFMVDGVSANLGFSNFAGQNQASAGTTAGFTAQGGTNGLVSVDALQEFRIQTSTFAPEFGRVPGAQISIVTRSGTNTFHGTLFEYFRNDVLDANDWFLNRAGLPKAAERQNDFGGVVGGPIWKNRTFFFFSYEGLRLRLPTTIDTRVPGANARATAPAVIQPYLAAFPVPTGPDDLVSNTAPFVAGYSDPSTLDAFSLRIDQVVNSKLTLFARYDRAPSETTTRGLSATPSTVSVLQTKTQTLTGAATWAITPRLLNDFRVNYSRNFTGSAFSNDTFGGAALPPPASVLFPSALGVDPANSGYSFYIFSLPAEHSGWFMSKNGRNIQRQINFVDSLAWQKGAHSLKFGVDYRRLFPLGRPAPYQFETAFLDVNSALALSPFFYFSTNLRPNQIVYQNLGMYAQDTWRASQRLTLTYGVRWDIDFAPYAAAGPPLLAVTQLDDLSTTNAAPPGTPVYHTRYTNFAPRLGVAYVLSSKNNWDTVLRGGFGIFYDLADQQISAGLSIVYPYGASNFIIGGTFPPSLADQTPLPIPSTFPGTSLIAADPNVNLPYSWQWNFGVEQGLGANQAISATYVGQAGRRLIQTEIHFPFNANAFAGFFYRNRATSDYHALQIQFQRRMAHGLQALASYTYSHSIDDASSANGQLQASAGSLFAPTVNNRASSDFDIRHTFTAALTYNIPSPVTNPFVHAVLRDWSVDNIVEARSAPPVDVFSSFETIIGNQVVESRPNVVPGQPLVIPDPTAPGGQRFNPAAFSTPPFGTFGDLGRNALRAFGAFQWDLAVRRQFALKDRLNLQFRVEFFNLLNHPNFGPPDNSFSPFNPQFGLSTQVLSRSLSGGAFGAGTGFSPLYQIGGPRSIQLALKLQF